MLTLRFMQNLTRPVCLWPRRTTPVNAAAALRFASKKSSKGSGGQKDCAKEIQPVCGPENIKELKKKGCVTDKKGKKKGKKESVFKSMWENPDCCKNPCPDLQVRFDELYYKISDKAKRTYYQTWVECPKKKIVQKPVCDYKNFIYPKHKKRSRKDAKSKTACSTSDDAKLLMRCNRKTNAKCVKITLPGCRGVRDPPKCKKVKVPADCTKICAPYPSFSECKKPKPKPRRPVECDCLRIASMCDVWAELRRRQSMKKA